MSESSFSRITIVSVTGLPDATGAGHALAISLRNMPGAQALLCSPIEPPGLPAGIRHLPIASLNYSEYSWFMMFALWPLIDTDYALIVQDDGWVLDGKNWRDEYLDYDYLGAVLHRARVYTPDGPTWSGWWEWVEFLDRPGYTVHPLLNGGFSLRSRRMLRALADHRDIQVVIPPPDSLVGPPLKMFWDSGATVEDEQLTTILRPKLEAVGLKFAPIELCKQFSMEALGPMHADVDFSELFGFHNRWRRLVNAHPPHVRYQIPQSHIDSVMREREMIDMLNARGYLVECLSA
jgi:hypothetical protein